MVIRRFLVDLMIIGVFVFLGRELIDDTGVVAIEERIEQFNQQVERGEIIHRVSSMHLNQTEENMAGKLGETLSEWITLGVRYTMETIALFFDEN